MTQIEKILCSFVAIVSLLVAGACQGPAPLNPDEARFKQAVLKQVSILQSVLGPALANGGSNAVDTALSEYFDITSWKEIACDFEVRVVDAQKRYVGGRMHLKTWDGSLPGPDVRLDYSQYGNSFETLKKGQIFARRFFNTDGPLVIIGGPIFKQGEHIGSFGIMLPGDCLAEHYRLRQDQILEIDYN